MFQGRLLRLQFRQLLWVIRGCGNGFVKGVHLCFVLCKRGCRFFGFAFSTSKLGRCSRMRWLFLVLFGLRRFRHSRLSRSHLGLQLLLFGLETFAFLFQGCPLRLQFC